MRAGLEAWKVETERKLSLFKSMPEDKDGLMWFIGLAGDHLRAGGVFDPRKFQEIKKEKLDLAAQEVIEVAKSIVVTHSESLAQSEEAAVTAGWAGLLCRRDWWQSLLIFAAHWTLDQGIRMSQTVLPIEEALHFFDEKIAAHTKRACFDPLRLLYFRAVLVLASSPEPAYVRWSAADDDWPRLANINFPIIDDCIPSQLIVKFTSDGEFEKRIRSACQNPICASQIKEAMEVIRSTGLRLHPAAQKLLDELCAAAKSQGSKQKKKR